MSEFAKKASDYLGGILLVAVGAFIFSRTRVPGTTPEHATTLLALGAMAVAKGIDAMAGAWRNQRLETRMEAERSAVERATGLTIPTVRLPTPRPPDRIDRTDEPPPDEPPRPPARRGR